MELGAGDAAISVGGIEDRDDDVDERDDAQPFANADVLAVVVVGSGAESEAASDDTANDTTLVVVGGRGRGGDCHRDGRGGESCNDEFLHVGSSFVSTAGPPVEPDAGRRSAKVR